MADEAVLRIKIEESGATPSVTGPPQGRAIGPAGGSAITPSGPSSVTPPAGGAAPPAPAGSQEPSGGGGILGPGRSVFGPAPPVRPAGGNQIPKTMQAPNFVKDVGGGGKAADVLSLLGMGQIGGMLKGVGSFAGPLAAAGVALKVFSRIATGATQSLSNFALGLTTPQVGAEQPFDLVGKYFRSVGEAAIDPISKMVAGIYAKAAETFVGLIQNFTGMTERYAQYNPALAQEVAMSEVRQTLNDIHRSAQLASTLVEFTRARSQLENAWEDAKMEFIKTIGPFVTANLRIATALLESIAKVADFWFGKQQAVELQGVWDAIQKSIPGVVAPPGGVASPELEGGI